jgi:hypothetical protein
MKQANRLWDEERLKQKIILDNMDFRMEFTKSLRILSRAMNGKAERVYIRPLGPIRFFSAFIYIFSIENQLSLNVGKGLKKLNTLQKFNTGYYID